MKRWLQMTTAALLILMLAPPAAAAEASFMKPEEQDGQAQEQEMRIFKLLSSTPRIKQRSGRKNWQNALNCENSFTSTKTKEVPQEAGRDQAGTEAKAGQRRDDAGRSQEDDPAEKEGIRQNTAHGKKKAASCSSNWNKPWRKKMSKRSLLR